MKDETVGAPVATMDNVTTIVIGVGQEDAAAVVIQGPGAAAMLDLITGMSVLQHQRQD
eukprot:SAG31_NODE_1420_length_8429_cov_32.568547_3_plen_58_part_00